MAEPRSLKIVAGALYIAQRCRDEQILPDRFFEVAEGVCVEYGVEDELMQRLMIALGYEFYRDFTINRPAMIKVSEHFAFMVDPERPEGAAN